ncbi:hypothetical protein N665_0303s0008 [Sinapis alba]|nr:hypothetical protein N665_0303s0008 [Sinapis alba]
MGGNGFRAVVSLSIIVFLLVGNLASSATSVPSTETVKKLRFSDKDANLFHESKRKVPNGPDPIHNRKARTSRLPPRV